MLLMVLPLADKTGFAAARVLGLVPPRVSTNRTIIECLEHLVKLCTEGIETTEIYSFVARVFLGIIAFIGYYNAADHILDVLGHCANAPLYLFCSAKPGTS